ncbi:TetR/AcrR family transcriptional regulator [Plantibacter sp. Mn2098]|uniref:TetR/AcrR family transcriptional regulator n=1 Tax=Plantibacter sp. Mn2098 TaxID=3395266 RepID=UPI003BD92B56
MESTTTGVRVGGRSALVIRAVRNAVFELIEEQGREKVTIPLIAERAGVNPTSIYRRWGDLGTLINDMATYRLDPARPLPDTGDLRSDLTAWTREIVEHYRKPVNAEILRGGAAVAGDGQADCLRDRRQEAELFAGRPAADGLSSDTLIDALIAPIVYRTVFLPDTLDDAFPERLVDTLLG